MLRSIHESFSFRGSSRSEPIPKSATRLPFDAGCCGYKQHPVFSCTVREITDNAVGLRVFLTAHSEKRRKDHDASRPW
jgi:hypothetical protein